ncbi:MAG: Ig-like domain-containing protein [Leptospirales bacterium]
MVHFKKISAIIIAALFTAFVVNCGGGSGGGSTSTTKKTSSSTDYVTVSSVLAMDNTTVKVIFDEGVSQSTAEDITNFASDNGLNIITATRDISDTTIVTLTTSSQVKGVTYTITVSNVTGTDGSDLDTSNNTGSFTGIEPADAVGPTIVTVHAVDKNTVHIFFNETVDPASLTTGAFTFSPTNGIGANPTAVSRDVANLSEVILTTNTQSSQIYTVTVANSVTDLAGNGVEASGNAMSFNGTAGDTAAPTVSLAALLAADDDNATLDAGVPHASVELAFSEDVDTASATTSVNYTFSNCTNGSISVVSVAMSGTDKVVILGDVEGNLTDGNTCKITVNNVDDLNANTIIPGTNSATITYFTAGNDTTKPTVIQAIAQNTTTVRITFTEPVDAAAANINNYAVDNGITVTGAAQVGASNSYDLTLDAGMSNLTYTVTATGISDLATVANAIDTNNNTATFTGDVKPSVSSILVLDNGTILVIFSEPLSDGGLTSDFTITGGAGINVTGVNLYASPNNNIIELTTDSQIAGVSYSLSVDNGSGNIQDTNGNVLDSAAASAGFSADALPTVASAAQTSSSYVEVTFSEAIVRAGMETAGNYTITCTTAGALTETAAAQTSATTVIVSWAEVLGVDDACSVTVANVTDLNGNTIDGAADNANFAFVTADTIKPQVVGAVAIDNTTVRVTFSENVTGGTGTYTISGLNTGAINQVGATTSYDITTVSQNLQSYTLTVTGVTDNPAGNAIDPAANTATFTGIAPPDTTDPSVFAALAVDNNTVDVTFDENVDLTTSQTAGNYAIDNGLTIVSAERQIDNAVVRLTVSSQTDATTYTVTVSNVQDLSGNTIGVTNTAQFTGLPDSGPPTILAIYQYDCDSNGNIDEVTIRFDGGLQDSSISKTDASRFTMEGITFIDIDDTTDAGGVALTCANTANGGVDPDTADDAYITLVADDVTIKGTTVKAITYSASTDRVEDASGNDLVTFAFTSASPEMIDEAAPVILSGTTDTGTTDLRILFSEPVYNTNGGSGALDFNDFAYCNDSDGNSVNGCSGGSDISNVTATVDGDGSDSVVVLTGSGAANFSVNDLFKDSFNVEATAIYDAKGNAAVNTVANMPVEGIIRPYFLSVSQVGNTTLRVTFSEDMNTGAATSPDQADGETFCVNESSASPADVSTNCNGGASEIDITAVSALDNKTFDLTLASAPTSSTTYYLHADTAMVDLNDNSALTTPTFGSFVGSEPPKLLKVETTGLNTVIVTFTKPMTGGSTTACTSIENPANYAFSCSFSPNDLGGVTTALQQTDPSKVLLTTSGQQGVGYCTLIVQNESNNINGTCGTGTDKGVQDAFGLALADNPGDRGSFEGAGGSVTTFEDGPLFTDPFADGTSFSFAFVYNNKVYLGPNDLNTGAFRFEADGANGTAVVFQTAAGYCTITGANPTGICYTFGDEITTDNGPNGVDGIGYFASGNLFETGDDRTVQANIDKQFLFVGPVERVSGTQLNEIWWTSDQDSTLNFEPCGITSSAGTKSAETIYSYGEHIYVGLAIDGTGAAKRPGFEKFNISSGTCIAETKAGDNWTGMKGIPAFGGFDNGDVVTGSILGIDSMIVFNGKMYLGNSGGVVYSTLDDTTDNTGNIVSHTAASELPSGPGSFSLVVQEAPHSGPIAACASVPTNWCQGSNRTLYLSSKNDITPGMKGIPFMVEYNSKLYMARNVTTASATGTTQNGGELWVCSANCHLPANWSRILTSTTQGADTGIEIVENRSISLLQVSAGKLFIGFDNIVDGARLYSATDPTAYTHFTETGRVDGSCANTSDGFALGGYCFGFQFFSSSNITKGASDYFYVSNGCVYDQTDAGVCDYDPAGGTFELPAIRVLRKVIDN